MSLSKYFQSYTASLLVLCCASTGQAIAQQAADKKHPAESIVAQAGDPTAPLAQVQVTNYTSNDIQNGDGYTNMFEFQPVIPISKAN